MSVLYAYGAVARDLSLLKLTFQPMKCFWVTSRHTLTLKTLPDFYVSVSFEKVVLREVF